MGSKQEIKAKQIGRNLVVIIDEVKYTKVTSDNKQLDRIKNKILLFNKRNSKVLKDELLDIFNPSRLEKERKVAEKKGLKKVIKRLENSTKKQRAITRKENEKLIILIDSKLNASEKGMIKHTNEGLAMKGFEHIPFPQKLVNAFKSFLEAEASLKALINFWHLCLLNPNPIARTKLFDYLSRHKFTITPSGYFVTYRMVKRTKEPDVFTDAHTGKFKIKIGELVTIPRKDCDEDGSRDCSKGLHVGSPDFIGIKKGDGYGKGQIGTGYVDFDPQFGDQPIIAFVNPAHVVSVPNSETRKLRCCEYYPFKLTTPEEVIQMEDSSLMVFEHEYKAIEYKQIQELLKNVEVKKCLEIGKGNEVDNQLQTYYGLLAESNEIKLSNDNVNDAIDLEQLKLIINRRQIMLK